MKPIEWHGSSKTYQSKHTRQKSLPRWDDEDPWCQSKTDYLQQPKSNHFNKNDIFQDIMNLQCLREKHQISGFLIQFSLFKNSGYETNWHWLRYFRSGEYAER